MAYRCLIWNPKYESLSFTDVKLGILFTLGNKLPPAMTARAYSKYINISKPSSFYRVAEQNNYNS